MPNISGVLRLLGSTSLFLTFGIGGMLTAVTMPSPGLSLPRASASSKSISPSQLIDQAWTIIDQEFLDLDQAISPEQWTQLRRDLIDQSSGDISAAHEAIRSLLARLDQPSTRFLSPQEFKESQANSDELTGIGAQLTMEKATQKLIVLSPIEGSPASIAGLLPMDRIVSIDGTPTQEMTTIEAVALIRGQAGTEVILGLMRQGKSITIPIVRGRIRIPVVSASINSADGGVSVGYIHLKQFNRNAQAEMKESIRDLEEKGVQGYILDLRGNPGGLLDAGVAIAEQWLNQGDIVVVRTRKGVEVRRASGLALTDKPIVVLVDRGTAGAGEILAGALQDNGRALVVGQTTFGSGLMQTVRALADDSAIYVTTGEYLTPSGRALRMKGIQPDVAAALTTDEENNLKADDLGTSKDRVYKVAELSLLERVNP